MNLQIPKILVLFGEVVDLMCPEACSDRALHRLLILAGVHCDEDGYLKVRPDEISYFDELVDIGIFVEGGERWRLSEDMMTLRAK